MTVLTRALAAETVRVRHTASVWIPLAGLAICLWQGLGWWTVSTQTLRRWDQLLAWQTAYATGLCAPLAALLAALTVRREARARSAGTIWRPAGPAPVRIARMAILTLPLLVFDLAVTVPIPLFGLLAGLQQPPIGRLLLLAVALWAGSLPVLALALIAAERIGIYATLGLAVVWQVAGTLQALSQLWWIQPWTWAVRAALPILRTHPNGVAAEQGDAVLGITVWPPIVLSILFTAVLAAVVALLPTPQRPGRSKRMAGTSGVSTPGPRAVAMLARTPAAVEQARPGRPNHLAAALQSCRHIGLVWIGLAFAAATAITFLGWSPSQVALLYGVLLLPAGSCLIACLTVNTQVDALRVVLVRTRATSWGSGIMATLMLGWTLITCWTSLLAGTHLVPVLITGVTLGAALLLLNLWLATRFGIAASLGVTLIGVVLSLVFGTTDYADSNFWLLGPWAWAYSADSLDRSLIAGGISLLLAVAVWPAWIQSLKRVAGR